MQNDIQIFENIDFGKMRILQIDGAPWLVGKDVADILGYANSRKALSDHVDEDDKLEELRNQRAEMYNADLLTIIRDIPPEQLRAFANKMKAQNPITEGRVYTD